MITIINIIKDKEKQIGILRKDQKTRSWGVLCDAKGDS